MNTENIILATDSYKLNHWNQYPRGTTGVYSYFESRAGAQFPETIFFGLQYILKRYLLGSVVSWDDLSEANRLSNAHFGNNRYFNYHGWSHIIEKHGGRLPLRIKAIPEGTPVPTGNVLMTVENTDPECYWLTNAVESLLTHVWYPSTVATLSYHVLGMIGGYLADTAETMAGLPFMLHDFGYRGASSHESAAIGGAAHLINSLGTDTIPAMLLAMNYYGAQLEAPLALSVAATEHSVMTARGEDGERDVVGQLLDEYPEGILSVVADSYDIYRFVKRLSAVFHERIMGRDGVFVVRPDSVTERHETPEALVVWIANQLWKDFGGLINEKGYRVLDSHIRILWGDGIDGNGIQKILGALKANEFSAENMVFGMGGGLLQKHNRDTQRFAFKASAIRLDGLWHDVHKKTLAKTSKAGRMRLIHTPDGYETVKIDAPWRNHMIETDMLQTVFQDGKLITEYTFDEVRANANRDALTLV